jgi:hypothetical protein
MDPAVAGAELGQAEGVAIETALRFQVVDDDPDPVRPPQAWVRHLASFGFAVCAEAETSILSADEFRGRKIEVDELERAAAG